MDCTYLRRLTKLSTAKSVVEEFEYRRGQGIGCVILDDYTSAETIKYQSEGILHRELLVDLKVRQYLVIIL